MVPYFVPEDLEMWRQLFRARFAVARLFSSRHADLYRLQDCPAACRKAAAHHDRCKARAGTSASSKTTSDANRLARKCAGTKVIGQPC
eukprot:scaffold2859_cov349-Pavlova_lutheri.AAC.20